MAQKVLASYFDDEIGYRDNNLYDANMWYERHPYKMEIVGSTPTVTTNINIL